MKSKTAFVIALLAVLTAAAFGICAWSRGSVDHPTGETTALSEPDDGKLKVVTSFYPVYIAALNIADGIDGVSVRNLSEPQTGCLHDYQLSADDVRLLSDADLFLVNGGGMESFLGTEDFAKRFPGLVVVSVNENLPPEKCLRGNAHYWMDLDLYEIYVQKVAIALSDADLRHAPDYMDNFAVYRKKLDALVNEAASIREESSAHGAVILNEALIYLANELGIHAQVTLDLDDGAELSAAELSSAVDSLLYDDADIIISDNVYGADIARILADETGCPALYLDPLVTGEYNKEAYLKGMEANLKTIRGAFQ